MDNTVDVWAEELSKKKLDDPIEEHKHSKNFGTKPEVPDELKELMNKALPRGENEHIDREGNDKTLYDLLDIAPHGRKLLNELFSGPRGRGDVFQHYEKSAIHKQLVEKVDSWIVEEEEFSGDTGASRAVSQGEYSSAIFSWSSANKDKKKPSSTDGKRVSSRGLYHHSLNQTLRKKAYAGINELLAQRRDQERQRELEKISFLNSTPIAPSTFKVDPLQKFEARALPRERKKKPKQQKKRSSILWFWKGSSHTEKAPVHQSKDKRTTVSAQLASDSHIIAQDVEDLNAPKPEAQDLDNSPSLLTGQSSSTQEGILQNNDEPSEDEDSIFGEFESAVSPQPVSDTCVQQQEVTSNNSNNKETMGAVMNSFTPLQPKRKN
ncbi:LANO_0H11782g1_1 [Lachancea nothofagi CBS 11611]|uniref:LANO_0H11782g1_1 n=1 Tax=Lachancea nothofagi CBS 11611 TaxID=1266666 RepID=A0A1G4KM39_9SACH|nr:LANO_0H11782g1_1 [Lachancea nothofagi CBS 11611]